MLESTHKAYTGMVIIYQLISAYSFCVCFVFLHLQDLFGRKDFLPQNDLIKFFATEFCSKKPLSVLCGNIFFLLCGFDEKNLNMV